jgi:hypothetical protein
MFISLYFIQLTVVIYNINNCKYTGYICTGLFMVKKDFLSFFMSYQTIVLLVERSDHMFPFNTNEAKNNFFNRFDFMGFLM